MRYFPIITALLLFGCQTRPTHPDGGFDYPKNVSDKDTNFYYYPLKDIEPARDAFYDSYTWLFYQCFNEPNLSLKPQPKETFRLTYSAAFHANTIISLTEDQITVKKGSSSDCYGQYDTARLTNIEKFHFELLNRKFPIDTSGKKYPRMKHYYDSLVKLYPQLLDPSYFHKLYDKVIPDRSKKFTYPVTMIHLTKEQRNSWIEQLDSSGFWPMTYDVKCEEPPMDGYAFTLEANTKKKYKIVTVYSCPGDTTQFTKACQKLVDLAGLTKEIKLVWSWSHKPPIVVDVPLQEIKDDRQKHKHLRKYN
jgi:hypothetical protein